MAIAKLKPSKKWGVESEFTKRLREKQLEAVIDTRCSLCNVGVRRSAKAGIDWFKSHQQTAKHKRRSNAKVQSGRAQGR